MALELLLLIIAIPLLVLVSPRFIRPLVSLLINLRNRSEKSTLQLQIIEYRKDLAKISQVDEFAKYSKVQRKLRAVTDQLNTLTRQDLELNFKYVLVAQGIAWLFAVLFALKLVHHIYSLALNYIGWKSIDEERLQY